MDMKILLEKLSEAMVGEVSEMEHVSEKIDSVADEHENAEDFKIKLAVGFERLASLLFVEQDMKIGRIALRKVLLGKQDVLNLRERNVMANSLIHLLPVVSGDRTVFSRIENKLEQISASKEEK
jgi:hypothetical protein